MKNDPEAQWLREEMQELRRRREASAASFERVWRAARERHAALHAKPVWPSLALAGASCAAVAAAAIFAFHSAAERKHSRQREREFAAVDGVLMTYWQAPSDGLLPVHNESELPHLDE